MAQPVIANGSIVTLDIGILLGLPRLDITQFDALAFRPLNQLMTDEFWTVVAANRLGFATPLNELG